MSMRPVVSDVAASASSMAAYDVTPARCRSGRAEAIAYGHFCGAMLEKRNDRLTKAGVTRHSPKEKKQKGRLRDKAGHFAEPSARKPEQAEIDGK